MTFFIKLFQFSRMVLFYLFNGLMYNHLEFKSLVIRPLQIVGKRYITIRSGVIIKKFSSLYALKIKNNPILEIGCGSSIGHFNHIASVNEVIIGNNVLTADNVYISDNIHEYNDINIPIMDQPVKFKSKVYIGDGSWIGENVSVIGAKVGKHCIIGANAVVVNDIPDYSVAVGIPAKVIKQYNNSTQVWEDVP